MAANMYFRQYVCRLRFTNNCTISLTGKTAVNFKMMADFKKTKQQLFFRVAIYPNFSNVLICAIKNLQ